MSIPIALSRVMRKLTFCICVNKDADQLRGNSEADQRLCLCYIDSSIPPLPKSYLPNVLVIPRKRWLHPNITEKLFTGTLRIKSTNQPTS